MLTASVVGAIERVLDMGELGDAQDALELRRPYEIVIAMEADTSHLVLIRVEREEWAQFEVGVKVESVTVRRPVEYTLETLAHIPQVLSVRRDDP